MEKSAFYIQIFEKIGIFRTEKRNNKTRVTFKGEKMFDFLKKAADLKYAPVGEFKNNDETTISSSLKANIDYLKMKFGKSFDLMIREVKIGKTDGAFIICDGMCNSLFLSQSVIWPILNSDKPKGTPDEKIDIIKTQVITDIEKIPAENMGQLISAITAGFIIFLLDGSSKPAVFGVQGYQMRSIDEPSTEAQERGSREGFVENFKINASLVRRRLQTPEAKIEIMKMGEASATKVLLCYMSDRVKPEILENVKKRLNSAEFDTVFESGYIQPFLDQKGASLFSGVGVTERPDVFCAKLTEGRVGVIVDGTPFALIVPFIFAEHFHSFDDYANRPYYAVFIRIIKMISFFLSVFTPGLYVAAATFSQELLPKTLLFDIISSHAKTPFPILIEAVIIHIIFEVMREAGLRLPKSVGHAVSIVGGLVIGEAAVSAGLIAPPMLIVVALTAITSFVVPNLYQPMSVLRFVFIFVGGILGIYGIVAACILIIFNMCRINPYGVPFMSPFSPFETAALRDTVFRLGWKDLSRRQMEIQDLKGG